MNEFEERFCSTVEKVKNGDEDAKDDLDFDAYELLSHCEESYGDCRTYKEMYNKILLKHDLAGENYERLL